ncbi:MAG: flagellin [Ilumatobacteraceae bacterium]|nr:flagellin [Ilumatobacteraceae bacterium]
MRINQNVMANNAARNLSATNVTLGKSLEKLSSGFRINRAADDAAGLVISQGLRAQISGLSQATRNAQDGISVVQTAEGALNEVHTMLTRMRDLSVQAANTGANDSAARAAAQQEVSALRTEIDRISSSTRFGGTALLDGTYGVTAAAKTGFAASGSVTVGATDTFSVTVTGGSARTVTVPTGTYSNGSQLASAMESAIKSALAGGTAVDQAAASKISVASTTVGAGFALTVNGALAAGSTVTLTAVGAGTAFAAAGMGLYGTSTAAAGTGGTFQIGATATDTTTLTIGNVSTTGVLSGIAAIDISSGAGATAAITALDSAISTVSTTRGNLGALQNRFESMINNLQVTTENLSASESRIRDTDMAAEMVTFTKNQVLQQAGTAMLAQANQIPQTILSLLR